MTLEIALMATEFNSSSTRHTYRYGYRGRDARSNIYLLPTGEIVYFTAAVVVLYNIDEQMQRHYLGHNDDVKWFVQVVCLILRLSIRSCSAVTIHKA
jgi:HELP motif